MKGKNEYACPVAATTRQAMETAAFSGAAVPSKNHITALNLRQATVSSVLSTGVENAVPARQLVEALSVKDIRELTRMIERERRLGFPICAAVAGETQGYYLAGNAAELEQYIASLDRRLKSVRATRTALQDTLDKVSGQTQIIDQCRGAEACGTD